MSQKVGKFHLWTVHHPDITEVWILSTKQKCIDFITKNEDIWAKHEMDSELFTFNKSYVRDSTLVKTIRDGMPELFL